MLVLASEGIPLGLPIVAAWWEFTELGAGAILLPVSRCWLLTLPLLLSEARDNGDKGSSEVTLKAREAIFIDIAKILPPLVDLFTTWLELR